MCGRYTLATTPEMIAHSFDVRLDNFDFIPRFNIAPSQSVLTICSGNAGKQARLMRWGLIPFWAKDAKIGYKMINARGETVADSRAFKYAFQKRRCLIPADSFYEWQGSGKSRQPIRIMLKSEEPFAFAGIWETWTDKSVPDAEPVLSCSIITTAPNSIIEPIHNRMPVILPKEL
ncbi:MAG: SOS response-associated peptidase [Lysobacterales bacterium]